MIRATIDRAIADIDRPMRWPEAERLSQKFLRAVLKKWSALNRDLITLIREISDGQSPAYTTLLANDRKKDFPAIVEKKNATRLELNSLIVELANYLTLEQLDAIGAIFDTYSPDIFSDPFSDKAGIFNTYYSQTIADGYRESYANMAKAPKDRNQTRLFAEVPEVLPVNPETPFIRAFYDRGFRLITAKITIDAKAVAFDTILEGLKNRTPWTDIAQNLYDKTGTGYLYHWKRLVRTEMTAAYYESFSHRYTEAGVPYVMLSLSVGACERCISLKGYYQKGTEPILPDNTHPNCRCTYLPIYRLPKNVTVRN